MRSCRLSQCCEPTAEERSAVNPHATFCGSGRRATASRDPVLGVKFPGPTRQELRCVPRLIAGYGELRGRSPLPAASGGKRCRCGDHQSNRFVSKLRFFFRVTLKRHEIIEHTHVIHEPRKLQCHAESRRGRRITLPAHRASATEQATVR